MGTAGKCRKKNKSVVFRKRGALRRDESWYYHDQQLEIEQAFNYLGVVFNVTGSFHLNNQYVNGKAMRASSILIHNVFKYDVKNQVLHYNCSTFL